MSLAGAYWTVTARVIVSFSIRHLGSTGDAGGDWKCAKCLAAVRQPVRIQLEMGAANFRCDNCTYVSIILREFSRPDFESFIGGRYYGEFVFILILRLVTDVGNRFISVKTGVKKSWTFHWNYGQTLSEFFIKKSFICRLFTQRSTLLAAVAKTVTTKTTETERFCVTMRCWNATGFFILHVFFTKNKRSSVRQKMSQYVRVWTERPSAEIRDSQFVCCDV